MFVPTSRLRGYYVVNALIDSLIDAHRVRSFLPLPPPMKLQCIFHLSSFLMCFLPGAVFRPFPVGLVTISVLAVIASES
ncbi:hypothetical protein DFH09DRAFT_1272887 [Mycena vulgaris]|nr:hypothetical protein DFH09DRAFT_1272887 [Mycena vulgaris]